jgi:hypothetical protein
MLAQDPARKVRVPTQLRETDKATLTWDQLRNGSVGPESAGRLLLELDMTIALRPSELFGLRWKNFNEASAPALPYRDYHRCLHAGDSRQRAGDGEFHPSRVAGEVQGFRSGGGINSGSGQTQTTCCRFLSR